MAKFHDQVRKAAKQKAPDFPLRLLFREVDTSAKFLGLETLSDTEVVIVSDSEVSVVRERFIGAKGRSWSLPSLGGVTVVGSTLTLVLSTNEHVELTFTSRANPDAAVHARRAWATHDLLQRALDNRC